MMKMDEKKKIILLMPIAFLCAVAVLSGLLILSAYIPNEKLVRNYKDSANYLCKKQVFFDVEKNVASSRIDRYADSILLNISWFFDKDKSIESVMWDSYYFTDYQNENNNLYDAVYDNKENNTQYVRYWHGGAAIVRILHLFMNVRQIYIFHAALLIILTICLQLIFAKRKMFGEMAAFIIGLISVSAWYVPMSLEYTWTFICMIITTGVVVLICGEKRKTEHEGLLLIVLMITGVVTNYLDFLTTETLSLLIPMLVVYRMRGQLEVKSGREADIKTDIIWFLKNTIAWGVGYVGMWCTKWLMASVVLKQNVMPFVSEHIRERIGGSSEDLSLIKYLWLSITRNINCLFPISYGGIGTVVMIIIIIVALYFGYVYHGKNAEKHRIIMYVVIGFVPLIRFIVLHNHSSIHYFFTYRALMACVMSWCLIMVEVVDWRYLKIAVFHR